MKYLYAGLHQTKSFPGNLESLKFRKFQVKPTTESFTKRKFGLFHHRTSCLRPITLRYVPYLFLKSLDGQAPSTARNPCVATEWSWGGGGPGQDELLSLVY